MKLCCAMVGCGLLVSFALLSQPVRAEWVTFEFRATVTDLFVSDNMWGSVGDSIVGTYSFDVTAPPAPGQQFPFRGGPIRIDVPSAARAWTGGYVDIASFDGTPSGSSDWYGVENSRLLTLLPPNDGADGVEWWTFGLTMSGPDLIPAPGLSAIPPNPANATRERTLRIEGDNSTLGRPFPVVGIYATVDSLKVVPDPAAGGAMLAASAWWFMARCRSRRNLRGE